MNSLFRAGIGNIKTSYKKNFSNLENMSFIFMFSGMIGDHISTKLGLLKIGLIEANPIVNWLINNHLWLPFDLFFFTLIMFFTKMSQKHMGYKYRHIIILSPLIIGIMRILAMINNLHLFFTF